MKNPVCLQVFIVNSTTVVAHWNPIAPQDQYCGGIQGYIVNLTEPRRSENLVQSYETVKPSIVLTGLVDSQLTYRLLVYGYSVHGRGDYSLLDFRTCR